MRELARTDLYFLLRYCLRRPDMQHPWLFQRVKEVERNPNYHLDLWARDHRKSSIITFGLSIQDVLSSHGMNPLPRWNGLEPSIGIFSHTRPVAKTFLRQIKRELETNDILKTLFPDVLYQDPKNEAPKWSEDDGLIVKRKTNQKEATFEAWGLVDGQPVGKHFTIRVYDDIVTQKSVASEAMARKTTTAWELSLNLGQEISIGSEKGGIERYIGTRYADADTYGDMLSRQVVTPRIYAATDDGTATGKPVLLSKTVLENKRRSMGFATFNAQMLLDPVQTETAFFKREWVKYYQRLPFSLVKYITFDAAVTKDKGDNTEIAVWGVDPGDNMYALDWWHGKVDTLEWIDKLCDLIKEHQPLRVIGEKGVIRRAVEPFLKRRMEERRAYVDLEWKTVDKSKQARAQSFNGRMAQGKVLWPASTAEASLGERTQPTSHWVDRVLKQLLRFPFGMYDDAVDCCSLMGQELETMVGAMRKRRMPQEIWNDYFFVDGDDEYGSPANISWKVV